VLRARDRAVLEAKTQRQARDLYGDICEEYEKNLRRGTSFACACYVSAMMRNARHLVPTFLDAKLHMQLVMEAQSHIKNSESNSHEDPREMVAAWLRGEKELTRIPFEKVM
jgi:hypothetical protein